MRLSWFFRLKRIVRWISRRAKIPHSIHSLSIPTIKYYRILNDFHYYCLVSKLTPLDAQICTDTVTNAKFNDHFIVCQPPRYTLKLLIVIKLLQDFSLIFSLSQQEITSIDNIVEKCIIMNLTTHLGLVFVSQFPNFIEMD